MTPAEQKKLFLSWILRKQVEARIFANAFQPKSKQKWASDSDLAAMGFSIG